MSLPFVDTPMAPSHLKPYLRAQVRILDRVIDNFKSGKNKRVNTDNFLEAKVEFSIDCEMVE